jgi:hypothetical protein
MFVLIDAVHRILEGQLGAAVPLILREYRTWEQRNTQKPYLTHSTWTEFITELVPSVLQVYGMLNWQFCDDQQTLQICRLQNHDGHRPLQPRATSDSSRLSCPTWTLTPSWCWYTLVTKSNGRFAVSRLSRFGWQLVALSKGQTVGPFVSSYRRKGFALHCFRFTSRLS